MATTTKLTASDGRYGHSSNKSYTSDANHLYVGKSSGTSDYTSRLTFPALSGLEEIGSDRIRITKMLLYIRRNESGSATTITAGCSSSAKWGAELAASASGSIANSTDGYQTIDITALADAVTEYGSKWYLHISGATPRTRFDSTGKTKKPYIMATWERVAATITGDLDSAELGADAVTFTIAPEVDGETHTLTYSLGDAEGTIATGAGDSIQWTPPLSLAAEITDDDTASVEIRMAAYDSSGALLRTETYYQTVTVPASVAPVISSLGASLVNGLKGYILAGRSSLKLAPVVDMNSAYGASISSLSATITGGQEIVWTSLTESDAGIYTGATAQTDPLSEGTVTLTVTATDSRGRTAAKSASYTVRAYSPPTIEQFEVFRYEPVYNENEEIDAYKPSDLGEYVAVTLLATATEIAPAGTQLNSLSWTITGVNTDGETVSASGTGDQSIQLIFDWDVFPGEVSEDEAWTYTLTLTDTAGGTAIQYSTVAPGHAAFSLSPDKYGAAVGMIASGAKTSPKFEVAESYETHFYGPVYDKNGAELLGSGSSSGGGAVSVADAVSFTQYIPDSTDVEVIVCDTRSGAATGLYLVVCSVRWFKNSTGSRMTFIQRRDSSGNGDGYATCAVPGNDVTSPGYSAVAIVPLEQGQWIEVMFHQDSGSSLLVVGNYQIVRLGG